MCVLWGECGLCAIVYEVAFGTYPKKVCARVPVSMLCVKYLKPDFSCMEMSYINDLWYYHPLLYVSYMVIWFSVCLNYFKSLVKV